MPGGCKQLRSVKIPNSVTEIHRYSFEWSGLTSIQLPNSVTFIGFGAFRYCTNLRDVKIPEGRKTIGEQFKGTPFWNGKCQNCGGELSEPGFLDKMRGYNKQCKSCSLVFKYIK